MTNDEQELPTLVDFAEDDHAGEPGFGITGNGGVENVDSCEIISISIAIAFVAWGLP